MPNDAYYALKIARWKIIISGLSVAAVIVFNIITFTQGFITGKSDMLARLGTLENRVERMLGGYEDIIELVDGNNEVIHRRVTSVGNEIKEIKSKTDELQYNLRTLMKDQGSEYTVINR